MVVLKYFSADWCGPCAQQKPIVNDVETDVDGVTVERHDADEEQELVNKFSIRSLPTLVVLNDDDQVTNVFTGITQKNELVSALNDAKNGNNQAPL